MEDSRGKFGYMKLSAIMEIGITGKVDKKRKCLKMPEGAGRDITFIQFSFFFHFSVIHPKKYSFMILKYQDEISCIDF